MVRGKIDLHTHTQFSDGFFSPADLIKKAKKNGIDIIGITDHDTVNGINEAFETGKKYDVEVIPGVEISTDLKDREIHLLAYFVDINNKELLEYLSFFRKERLKRAEIITKKLNNLGFKITINDVVDRSKNSAIGRPHIAQAMIERGIVKTQQEAFIKFLGKGCPAFEKKVHISPQSAVKIISDAGGLTVIAHPGNMPENILKELIEAGVDGIEVIHPSHPNRLINYYRGIANEYFLLETGGSDFHGGKREDEKNLGKYFTSFRNIEAMKKRLIKNVE